ncbi:MAG: phosphatase [Butyrivibrio sp.]|uniref:phosphatase n=1 Tax=Butyrivibrio sp. TaxID=28121 RepID=UPI0025DE4A95|nr:phosphatase [Butyrivibrio sp.]MCR5770508.1 phosphatase [Butyrivibrio sp.]
MEIRTDLHTHTLYSRHAYSTIEENARAASDRGLELLGTTDHFSSMLYSDYTDGKHYQYFYNMNCWPREWYGVKLLRGCEVDIVDLDGNLFGHDINADKGIIDKNIGEADSLYGRVTRKLDYCIASVHMKDFTINASKSRLTDMYIKALSNSKVIMLGHIGRTGLDFDIDSVITAARDMHKLIEINEHSFGWDDNIYDRCKQILVRCAELNVPVSVSTDAHISYDVGRFDYCHKLLESVDFPKELVANRDAQSFISYLPGM